jgi:hypothetical protein
VLALALQLSCSRASPTSAIDAGASPRSISGAALASSVFPPQASPNTASCSVVEALGRVQVNTGDGHLPIVVSSRSALPWPAWIALDDGARLTVEAPPSGQVFSFLGPATVEPCTRGEEHASVLEGRFQTVATSSAPIGVETIVTPFAVVRYERATLTVSVTERETVAQVADGEATAFDDRTMEFVRVAPGAHVQWTGLPLTVEGATAAVARCESDVATARTLDRSPSADASDQRAREAHIAAGAHCSLAELRVSALKRPSEPRASLVLRLDSLGPT